MRPVDRGPAPVDDATGRPLAFTDYKQAAPYLEAALGDYCSYCGLARGSAMAVEHVQPKSLQPGKEFEWANLLLACQWCNSIKQDLDVNDCNLADYLWPDRDNTARAFEYLPSGVVRVSEGLASDGARRAGNTIELVGLGRTHQTRPSASDRDKRVPHRRHVWDLAQRKRGQLAREDTALLRETLVELAHAEGFWSVWTTVFADDPDMLNRLTAAFPGTWPHWRDQSRGLL